MQAILHADDGNVVLAGHGRLEAARLNGMEKAPVLRFSHLSEAQKHAYVLADNRIAENAGWDREMLSIELGELVEFLPVEGLEVSLTGFEVAEIDLLLADMAAPKLAAEDALPSLREPAVSRRGDLWRLGRHRLLCGDARNAADLAVLMDGSLAAAVFCDPPYNVAVKSIGGRGRTRHREFAFASGEMSREEYREFLLRTLSNGVRVSRPGAVHYVCIDWRHVGDQRAGRILCGSRTTTPLELPPWTMAGGVLGGRSDVHQLLAINGILMSPLPLAIVAGLLAAAVAFALVLEIVKVVLFRHLLIA